MFPQSMRNSAIAGACRAGAGDQPTGGGTSSLAVRRGRSGLVRPDEFPAHDRAEARVSAPSSRQGTTTRFPGAQQWLRWRCDCDPRVPGARVAPTRLGQRWADCLRRRSVAGTQAASLSATRRGGCPLDANCAGRRCRALPTTVRRCPGASCCLGRPSDAASRCGLARQVAATPVAPTVSAVVVKPAMTCCSCASLPHRAVVDRIREQSCSRPGRLIQIKRRIAEENSLER